MRFFKKLKLHKLFEIAEEKLAYHYDKIDSIGNNLQKKKRKDLHTLHNTWKRFDTNSFPLVHCKKHFLSRASWNHQSCFE